MPAERYDLTRNNNRGANHPIEIGAEFTFSGRSFVFGVGALGEPGAEHVLDILVDEVDRTLTQLGCTDITQLGPDYLWPET